MEFDQKYDKCLECGKETISNFNVKLAVVFLLVGVSVILTVSHFEPAGDELKHPRFYEALFPIIILVLAKVFSYVVNKKYKPFDCPKCGSKSILGSLFCGKCGTRFK
jgi:predicted RNA-binding Zn-ribbon protein involved in translation (DUF1610 family)